MKTTSITMPFHRVRKLWRFFAIAVFLLASYRCVGQPANPPPSSEILRELRGFRELGGMLYIGAHPDDENTQLITYLSRGRHERAAYLSLTRGDGGQNVLGPEFDEELGAIRTQELLAARRIDGGRQFFTRAIDFGFSKDYLETLNIWNRQQVLSDIVRVIRLFRPDVLITATSPQPSNTHGHHTAAAVLALEAFKLAGDPKAFPEQLGELTPWQPKRIFQNVRGGGRGGESAITTDTVRMDVGGNDPVSGESFGDLAGRSRSMHKTQGFGNFSDRGGGGGGGARMESFRLLAGDPASQDIFDGVDTTWGRYPGGAEIGTLTDEVLAKFDPQDPAGSAPALLAIRSRLADLPSDPLIHEKHRQLDRIVQDCLGLSVETVIPQAEVVPGEILKMRQTAIVQSGVVSVRWMEARYPGPYIRSLIIPIELHPDQVATRDESRGLPDSTPLTQPYWLREPHTTGMYRVDDLTLIGRPENPPAFPIVQVFEVDGQTLEIPDEPVQVTNDPKKGEIRQKLEVIAPVSLKFASAVRLFAPGTARLVEIEVTAYRAEVAGAVHLNSPDDWKVTPASQLFHLARVGDKARFAFTVTAPARPGSMGITVQAEVKGKRYDTGRVEIRYDHIPPILLQPTARLKAVCLDLAIRGRRVGYVPGAGDSVAECLEQMGYTVKPLSGADLTSEGLRGLDAVVFGVRAFNVRSDLAPALPVLFAYVEAGGAVIEQYNRPNGLQTDKPAPYDLRLSGDRVTDENAPVTFLAPDHPALNAPNKITSADFEGWVQERGVYFPNQWDEHFTPIIACGDPGETPLKGGLLIAKYGKGYFVYTGLAFFRQLPAGVPGAYRLFANLVSLGKE